MEKREAMLESLEVGDGIAARARVAQQAEITVPLQRCGTNQHTNGGGAEQHLLSKGSTHVDAILAIARNATESARSPKEELPE